MNRMSVEMGIGKTIPIWSQMEMRDKLLNDGEKTILVISGTGRDWILFMFSVSWKIELLSMESGI